MNRPAFQAALNEHARLCKTLGDEHPATVAAMLRAAEVAPPEVKAMIEQAQRELDELAERLLKKHKQRR